MKFLFTLIVSTLTFSAQAQSNIDALRNSSTNAQWQIAQALISDLNQTQIEALQAFQVDPVTLTQIIRAGVINLDNAHQKDFFENSLLPAMRVLEAGDHLTRLEAQDMNAGSQIQTRFAQAFELVSLLNSSPRAGNCSYTVAGEYIGVPRSNDASNFVPFLSNFSLKSSVGFTRVANITSTYDLSTAEGLNAAIEAVGNLPHDELTSFNFRADDSCLVKNNKCCQQSSGADDDSCNEAESKYCKLTTRNGTKWCTSSSQGC